MTRRRQQALLILATAAIAYLLPSSSLPYVAAEALVFLAGLGLGLVGRVGVRSGGRR